MPPSGDIAVEKRIDPPTPRGTGQATPIADRLTRFIDDELLDADRPEGDPLALGLLDSLDLEQVVAFIEDEFGIEMADEDLRTENFSSVPAVAALIQAKRSG